MNWGEVTKKWRREERKRVGMRGGSVQSEDALSRLASIFDRNSSLIHPFMVHAAFACLNRGGMRDEEKGGY